jgi:chromosome partitioning protein
MSPATTVAMMNMKGGVGKSTLTANLGWYAAVYRDLRVLLVDLDPQFNLSQYILGIDGYEALVRENALTVEAIFRQSAGEAEAPFRSLIRSVQEWGDGSVLHILPAGLELAWSMRLALEKSHVLRDSLSTIRDEYDIIMIDCAPTESILSTAAYHAADYIFVPVKTEFLSTIGLPLLLRSLEEFRRNHINEAVPEIGGIIFNDTTERAEDLRSRAFVRQVADQHGLYVFAHEVSRSASYAAGARSGKPIFMTDNARDLKKREFGYVAREFFERIGR